MGIILLLLQMKELVLNKEFIVHVSANDIDTYSMSFPTQKEMVVFLRQRGVRFRNGIFKDLGTKSIILNGSYSFTYEVEEALVGLEKVIYEGAIYIPIKSYCELTGQKRSTVYRAYKNRHIRSVTIGKYNFAYIYWRHTGR